MGEIRLVVRDVSRDIFGEGYVDAAIGALSAEPETIEELEAAMARFQKPGPSSFFSAFEPGIHEDPRDDGIVIIDLAARLMVYDCEDEEIPMRGGVFYHDGEHETKHSLGYQLPDDWRLNMGLAGWHELADERRRERRANPRLVARPVLYGRPLLEFVAAECWDAPAPGPAPEGLKELGEFLDTWWVERAPEERPPEEALQAVRDWRNCEYDVAREIHIRWMMTPPDDLRGRAPRDVLLEKKQFIDRDLQDRAQQWSTMDQCPPGLDSKSHAYRFAGFGTHELVMYYHYVRHLVRSCRDKLWPFGEDGPSDRGFLTVGDFVATEVPRLARAAQEWLDEPDPEYGSRAPQSIIERERARLPEGGTGHEAMVDHDCPLCQMMADIPGPVFWHLDGSGMDEDLAFAFHRTREEYDAERREWEEFDRKYREREAERKRLEVESYGEGYADPDSTWRRSFVAEDAPDFPAMRLFAIGPRLAELTADLKEPTEDRPLIDRLRRRRSSRPTTT